MVEDKIQVNQIELIEILGENPGPNRDYSFSGDSGSLNLKFSNSVSKRSIKRYIDFLSDQLVFANEYLDVLIEKEKQEERALSQILLDE